MGVEAKAGVIEGGSLGGRIEYELESEQEGDLADVNAVMAGARIKF